MLKECTKCGSFFECLESTDCWCNKLNTIHTPSEDVDCLCEKCLSTNMNLIENKKLATIDCKKHKWIVGIMDPDENLILFECATCHMQHEVPDVFDQSEEK